MLLVLKGIGIAFLILLLLVIFILCMVLFVPIRYQFHGSYKEALQGEAKITWAPLLLKAHASFADNHPEYVVKALGGVIMTNTDAKLSWLGRKISSSAKKEETELKDKIQVIEEEPLEFLSEENPVPPVQSDREQESAGAGGGTFRKTKREKRKPLPERLKEKWAALKERIRAFIQKLREISEKKDNLIKVYHTKRFDLAKQDVIQYIKEIFRIIKPDKLSGYVHFGLEDPATTGQVLGVLSLILPLYQEFLVIRPDFEEACVEGNLEGKGKIYLVSVAKLVLKIIFNKNLIKVTKKVQTIIEA